MSSPPPRLSGPQFDTVIVAGRRTRRARWTVAWPDDALLSPADHILPLLPPGSSAGAAATAALLNAAALECACRLHARSGPDFEAFVTSAPRASDERGFAFCSIEPIMARLAAESAVHAVHQAISRGPAACRIDDLLQEAHRAIGNLWPSKDAARVLLEAWHRGIPVTRLADHVPAYRLGHGRRQAKLFNCFTHRTPQVANVLTTSKATATQVLLQLGFPVPPNQIVQTVDKALAFVARIGYPVVIKPNAADFGRGVTAEIRSDDQLVAAFERARAFGTVLVERHVPGENYRLLVIDGVCRGVNHRVQPDVIGDGTHTIAELMRAKIAAAGVWLGLGPDDPLVAGFLAGLGRRLDDVPAAGERVRTSAVANASAGGTRVPVTDLVHPDNKQLAESVAKALDIDLAGIDLITPDVTRSWHEVGGTINEVNVNPGLPFPEAPGWVLDGLFPNGSNGRVDITVVLGDLSGREAEAIVDWVRRGRVPSSRNAILGRPADATGRRQPLDRAQAQPVVEQLLGRPELDSLVVQAAWDGTGPLVLPVPYQARLLVSPESAHQAPALKRLTSAMLHDPTMAVATFDIRAFERD